MHYIPLSSEALFFWNSAYNYKPWLTSLLLLVTNYWNIVFYGILTKIFFRVESKYTCFKRKIILRCNNIFSLFFFFSFLLWDVLDVRFGSLRCSETWMHLFCYQELWVQFTGVFTKNQVITGNQTGKGKN